MGVAYRNCVAEFATGVTVVTAEYDGVPAGMTLNSFTSISLHPLLILVSLTHGARTLHAVRGSGRFAVSILHRQQQAAAVTFAKRGVPFAAEHVTRDRNGFLTIPDAAGILWCRVASIVTAGDHDLVLGEVFDFLHAGGEPLIFHRGTLGGLQPDTAIPIDHPIGLEEGAGW
ncbi:MAG: flavin reductase family protein [Chloroflexota bacterium]